MPLATRPLANPKVNLDMTQFSSRQAPGAYLRTLTLVAGCGLILVLGGCSGIGNALGFSKRPPDEFEVLAKAPLVVPPDYNLRPPAEEELALKERNPRDMAYRALFPPRAQTSMPAVPPEDVGVSPLSPGGSGITEDDLFAPRSGGDAGDSLFN